MKLKQIHIIKNHFNEQHNKLVENCLKTDLLNLNCQANVQAKSQAGFDYNDHGPQEKLQNQKPCQMIKSFSSQQLTHYKYNFSQNPTYQKVQFKDMSLQPLLSKEPLQKSSLYQDNFQKKQKKQDIEIMNSALVKRTPYSEVLSFGHNTQNRQTYQGQQVYDKTNLVYQSDHLANLNSINHYQATSQDYGKVQSLRCE